ncbi:MAG: YiiD C-terminal domain-containing protein [Pseudomonadales bacterium]|nr:YiiD C-terminal domain-containing protein [Pseudomonadales bacterium]MBO6595412.1 YiiD C-terminal domain-containing protein [Pseudomonadales bacterium]MBO6658945.1 YiiD C-terminal domain-containing protein [Pseudomonadales bacterium]MBO6701912.1 YiiD C-terminal domain-containing protein [Pseudomonadales bacterium]MBO6821029.1 YiiD C-terminal domain-containing protein [Pseudomonadales bacterium]
MSSSNQTSRPRIYVDSIDALESAFHDMIPISKAMGVKVVRYNSTTLTTRAPLDQNINHQHSAFGGSLFSLAAMSGWGLLQLKLSELLLDCNTVVVDGEASYHTPVYDDLECTVRLPENSDELFAELAEMGKVRTELVATFESGNKVAMQMKGRYHLKMRETTDA